MRIALPLAVAALLNVLLHPISASADGRFATVESIYSDAGGLVVGSLLATADQSPVEGQYLFKGYAISQGKQVPWTVSVPAEGDSAQIASVTAAAGSVSKAFSYSFNAGDVEVTKTFFDVTGEKQSGVMTVTDDPLPIIGWLVIAGAAAILVPLGVYVAEGCEKITTKTTFTKDGVSYETSCEKQ